MKKLLLTNNSAFIEDQYDEIYTDSPFVVEKFNNAKYLNELLDPDYHNKIIEIRKKGFEINRRDATKQVVGSQRASTFC